VAFAESAVEGCSHAFDERASSDNASKSELPQIKVLILTQSRSEAWHHMTVGEYDGTMYEALSQPTACEGWEDFLLRGEFFVP